MTTAVSWDARAVLSGWGIDIGATSMSTVPAMAVDAVEFLRVDKEAARAPSPPEIAGSLPVVEQREVAR